METKNLQNKAATFGLFLKDFNNKPYMGYIWMVEAKAQKLNKYIEETIIDFNLLNTTKNPFNKIQEAYLSDGKNAIHIKTIDGETKTFVFGYNDFCGEDFKIETREYPSHIKGIETIHFKQVYKLMPSLSGDAFKTWQPLVKLFVGFNLKEHANLSTL